MGYKYKYDILGRLAQCQVMLQGNFMTFTHRGEYVGELLNVGHKRILSTSFVANINLVFVGVYVFQVSWLFNTNGILYENHSVK